MKKLLLAALIGLSIVAVSGRASAGDYVVRGATVVRVANSSYRGDQIWIQTSGGSGFCASPTGQPNGIIFRAREAASPESYQQAFSLALTALLTGKPVDIYNYDGLIKEDNGQCVAQYIEIQR